MAIGHTDTKKEVKNRWWLLLFIVIAHSWSPFIASPSQRNKSAKKYLLPPSSRSITYLLSLFPIVSAFQQKAVLQTKSSPITLLSNHETFKYQSRSVHLLLSSSNIADDGHQIPSSSSLSFAIDPTSKKARTIVQDKLNLSSEQHQKLAKLAILVNDWNLRINLISRKNCTVEVVFGRHILPSLAPLMLLHNHAGSCKSDTKDGDDNNNNIETNNIERLVLTSGQSVCDIGTGGGFPGLPLAIARPDVQFLLVDSVGKKILAVQNVADQLGLTNVKTFHGRAESVDSGGANKFYWVVGRSVSAIPQFAFWVYHLLQKTNGRLVYLIGGDIDDGISNRALMSEEIETLFGVPAISDKRVLVFEEVEVDRLAKYSRDMLCVSQRGNDHSKSSVGKIDMHRSSKRKTRGRWNKRDSSTKNQRCYDSFRRFESL